MERAGKRKIFIILILLAVMSVLAVFGCGSLSVAAQIPLRWQAAFKRNACRLSLPVCQKNEELIVREAPNIRIIEYTH